MAARLLADDGHSVTLHARSAARAEDARAGLPAARAVVVGDLSGIAGMRQVAGQASAGGQYDAVIHNAGVGYREPRRIRTDDGLEHVFAINVLAPYLLTGLIERPGRLVYLSSGMHRGGDPGDRSAVGPPSPERLAGILRQQAVRRRARLRRRAAVDRGPIERA